MTCAKCRGLTLVELLASLTLLSLVCGACMAWVTSVSRGSMSTFDNRKASNDILRAGSLIEELLLRSTDDRVPKIDPEGRLLIPTRWWVTSPSGSLDLATWARLDHAEPNGALSASFLNDSLQPLGDPRSIIDPVQSLELDPQSAADVTDSIMLLMTLSGGQQLSLSLTMETSP